jgi:hypothetical protein
MKLLMEKEKTETRDKTKWKKTTTERPDAQRA